MRVRILSFDYDGCLFHETLSNKNGYQKERLIESNKLLLETIKEENANFDYVITFIGSSRQSKSIDDQNRDRNESCFRAAKEINRFLEAEFDPFLLADLYGNLPDGTSYKRIKDKNYEGSHSEFKFDEYKVTLIYAQMHKIANKHPETSIVFDFYDDRGKKKDILDHLRLFYTTHHELIPTNITLGLHHYAGKAIKKIAIIEGSGFIDKNFRRTVKDMAALYGGNYVKITVKHVKPEKLKNRTPLVVINQEEDDSDESTVDTLFNSSATFFNNKKQTANAGRMETVDEADQDASIDNLEQQLVQKKVSCNIF